MSRTVPHRRPHRLKSPTPWLAAWLALSGLIGLGLLGLAIRWSADDTLTNSLAAIYAPAGRASETVPATTTISADEVMAQPTPTRTITPTIPPARRYLTVQTGQQHGKLNLRTRAGTEARVLLVLTEGAQLEFRGCAGAWVEVAYGTVIGFVHGHYVDDSPCQR